MTAETPSDEDPLVRRAAAGDREALGALLATWREPLRRMVARRLDPRLAGRVDASDVVQNACLESLRRLDEPKGDLPLPLWVRLLTGQEIAAAHRRHLGAQARDVRREDGLPSVPWATSAGVARDLSAHLTSPTAAAAREEVRGCVEAALDALDPLDREVLVLRHFDRLDNGDAARELGITPAAASKRHVRALARLKTALGPRADVLAEFAR